MTNQKRCAACGTETNLVTSVTHLGPVLLCRAECYPDAIIERDQTQAAGESFDITIWARQRYNRLTDKTRTERTSRRREQLNEKAEALGFKGLSQLLTAWKNDEIRLIVEPTTHGH